ncbi:cupin domain-containing protein [Pseudomonas sp. SZMC_28357]|uniref:cupin domain-containing protein n=1 Tax=Pseudomonas sp. SZMC_28357 TaxID=3074380 RepID=UPI002871970A|nr:cupin domain-containing protein [Pseudomonas sp. SZMC_28357]MDR9752605.1 cupin domain-containing protein [Pseudomonas sp. SZMC_28357]
MIHLTRATREFQDTDIPGVRFSSAWGENGDGSDFVAFTAGARFPLHDHEGREEILMMSGRIRFGDLELSAGDYLKIGPGEEHDAVALEDSTFFLSHIGGSVIKE